MYYTKEYNIFFSESNEKIGSENQIFGSIFSENQTREEITNNWMIGKIEYYIENSSSRLALEAAREELRAELKADGIYFRGGDDRHNAGYGRWVDAGEASCDGLRADVSTGKWELVMTIPEFNFEVEKRMEGNK
jgi:hypothetical protein